MLPNGKLEHMALAKHRKKVLVIDDEDAIHDLMAKVLESGGMLYAGARSTVEALDMADREAPHLILLDINLKGESGLKFLQAKAQIEALQRIPCIVISGEGRKEFVHQAINLGALDYIMKPVQVTILLRKIKKIIRQQFDALQFFFPPEQAPQLQVRTVGKIKALNEVRVHIESAVLFRSDVRVKLESELLNELGLANFSFSSISSRSHIIEGGSFLNQLSINGASESVARAIRKKIMRWK